jgi:hypothetical protein
VLVVGIYSSRNANETSWIGYRDSAASDPLLFKYESFPLAWLPPFS